MQIKNKIAVVTGASSGLGKAIAKALVKKGAKVYGLARTKSALQAIQQELGNNFLPVVIDISKEEAVKNWVKSTFNDKNTPEILINNAGLGKFNKIDEIPEGEWLQMMNSNLNGLYFITSNLVKYMKKTPESKHIINIGSVLGTTGRAESAAYCTTKFGVRGFTSALSKELRWENIKVTGFNPGSIETDFFKSSGIDSHQNMLQPKDLANTILHVLETPDNMLIDELIIRPLNPKKPD